MSSKEFNQLKKHWDDILKKEGMRENEVMSEQQDFQVDRERFFYFEKCWEFFHKNVWECELDEFIFQKHCEGYSSREIEKLLSGSNLNAISHMQVSRIIKKLLHQANIKPIEIRR